MAAMLQALIEGRHSSIKSMNQAITAIGAFSPPFAMAFGNIIGTSEICRHSQAFQAPMWLKLWSMCAKCSALTESSKRDVF